MIKKISAMVKARRLETKTKGVAAAVEFHATAKRREHLDVGVACDQNRELLCGNFSACARQPGSHELS
jgi:hypothetical protein